MSQWFDDYGHCINRIPRKVVNACAHPGECFQDVEYWQAAINFIVPRSRAIDYLSEFGAWTIDELQDMTGTELAQKVLWIACWDIKTNGEWFGLIH